MVKKLIALISCALLLIISGFTFAQDENQVEERLAQMKTELNLSSIQVSRLRTIFDRDALQAKQDMETFQGDRQAMRRAAQDRRKLTNEMVKNVLNEEQYKKYMTMGRGRTAHQAKWLNDLRNRLNLSDEQFEKVKQIQFESQNEMEAVRQESQGNRRDAMKKIRKLMEESDKEIMKVLNKKQRKEYKKIQDERREQMRNRMGGRRGNRGGF